MRVRKDQEDGEADLIADEETLAVDLDDVAQADFTKNRGSKEVGLVLAARADELLEVLVLWTITASVNKGLWLK